MACSDEVLKAAKAITSSRKNKEFKVKEVREYMKKKGTEYSDNSIRGQIVGNCNIDYPSHKLKYFRRIKDGWGMYKIIAKN